MNGSNGPAALISTAWAYRGVIKKGKATRPFLIKSWANKLNLPRCGVGYPI